MTGALQALASVICEPSITGDLVTMRGEKGRGDRSLLAGGERAASVFDWLQWFGGIDKLRDVDAFNGGSEEEGSP